MDGAEEPERRANRRGRSIDGATPSSALVPSEEGTPRAGTPSSVEGTPRIRREHCNFASCTKVVKERAGLAAELKYERKKYTRLERNFEIEVQGRVRVVHAELCVAQGLAEEHAAALRITQDKRNEYHRELKRAASERRELVEEKARLALEVKELRAAMEARTRTDAVAARADERRHTREMAAVRAAAM